MVNLALTIELLVFTTAFLGFFGLVSLRAARKSDLNELEETLDPISPLHSHREVIDGKWLERMDELAEREERSRAAGTYSRKDDF